MSERMFPDCSALAHKQVTSLQRPQLALEIPHLGAAGHQPADVLAFEILFGTAADHYAERQEGESVGDEFGVYLVVSDEDDRNVAASAHAHHRLQHFHLLPL